MYSDSNEGGKKRDLFIAIKERRSCRNFFPEQVEEATIEKILEAVTRALSPLNSQPWEFIVVTNREMKEKAIYIR